MSRGSPSQHKPKPRDEEEEDDDEDEAEHTLRKQFVAFIQYKNEKDPGTHILLSQSDFWMRQAGLLRGRRLTQTDTGVCYFKFKKYKLDFNEYLEFLQILADYKNIPIEEIIETLANCSPPVETNVNLAKPR